MKYTQYYTKVIFTALFITLFFNILTRGQEKRMHYALNLSHDISASGHKAGFLPAFRFSYQSHCIDLGAYVDYQAAAVKGINVGYHYIMNKNYRDDVQIYAHVQGIYRKHAGLCNRLNKLVYQDEYHGNKNTFTTIEAYAGFGLQVPLVAGFSVNGNIGAGTYRRILEQPKDYRIQNFTRFTLDQAAGLYLSIGLCYSF